MVDRWERYLWAGVTVVLVALAVPWFLWRSDAVVATLPAWLWWHIGWIALTALVFRAFARRAWGLGIEGGA
ncbi:MAG: DUF3311 domain-containing protein [Halobacteriales archaeon]